MKQESVSTKYLHAYIFDCLCVFSVGVNLYEWDSKSFFDGFHSLSVWFVILIMALDTFFAFELGNSVTPLFETLMDSSNFFFFFVLFQKKTN